MINTVIVAVTGALLAATAPAFAKDKAEPASATTTQLEVAAKPTQANRRYCTIDYVTGSRVGRKTCQTRAEWLAEGFDPLKK